MNNSAKFWDRTSSSYDSRSSKYSDTYKKMVANSKKYLKESDNVFELACGTGNITVDLASSVKQIEAIDISKGMLDIARKKTLEQNIENVNFNQTDIFDSNYKKESFDVLMAFNVLHLMSNTKEVITRINYLLKSGGIFISSTACLKGKIPFLSRIFRILGKIGLLPFIKSLDNNEFKDLISDCNFNILEYENLSQEPPNIFIIAKKL
jgi:ubiquinone/menaquinone biosynthesis C-methylase UbiE